MAITEAYSGTATIGTTTYSLPNASTTLTPIAVDGVYQVALDLSNVTLGDRYEVVVLEKITSGGSQLAIYTAIVSGDAANTLVMPSLILMHGWDVQVTKLAGTDRSIGWSIRQVA